MEHTSPLTAFTPDMFMRNFAEAEPGLSRKGAVENPTAVSIVMMRLALKPALPALIFLPLLSGLLLTI